EVCDVSASGLRVICDGKPPVAIGSEFPLRLRFSDGSVELRASVRWCRRRGLRRHEIGLAFLRLRPGMPRVLDSIARYGLASAARGLDEPRSESHRSTRHNDPCAEPRAEAELPNHYRSLGLEPGTSAAAIKAAYRRLAAKHHPDRSDAPDAAERFQAIVEAYRVLSDPGRRATYQRLTGC
ncbi:MAG: DnaJ domain-containing protein, partial [Phycisphaeraceae bacterium]